MTKEIGNLKRRLDSIDQDQNHKSFWVVMCVIAIICLTVIVTQHIWSYHPQKVCRNETELKNATRWVAEGQDFKTLPLLVKDKTNVPFVCTYLGNSSKSLGAIKDVQGNLYPNYIDGVDYECQYQVVKEVCVLE